MPLATSARAAAACSLAGLATATDGANVLDGARAVEIKVEGIIQKAVCRSVKKAKDLFMLVFMFAV